MSTTSSTTNSSIKTRSTFTSIPPAIPVDLKMKQAHDAFKRLQGCMKEISECEIGYADFANVIRERDDAINDLKAARSELKIRDREIYDLKRARELSLEDFLAKTGQLTRKWTEDTNKMLREHSSEKQTAKEELKSHQSKIASLSMEMSRAKEEAQRTTTQLDVAHQELAQWRSPASCLRQLDQKNLETEIGKLFQKCAQSVHNYFLEDLSADIVNNHDAWEHGIRGLKISVGIPPNNSQSAKLMRVAVALYVLSSELANTVFKPCYIPDSKEQSATLQETLKKCVGDDRKTRNFMHAQFLSTHSPEERRAAMHRWALAASANASRKLSFMCQDGGTTLNTRTRECFQSAADLWHDIQYIDSNIKIITSEDCHFPQWDWEPLGDFGDTSRLSEEELILFPGFYAQDTETELYKGYALWKDQRHVEQADLDWRSFQRMRLPRIGRGPSVKSSTGKRQSITINGGPTPPLSPTSSPKELRSQTYLGTGNR